MTRLIQWIATAAPFLMLTPTAYLVAWRTVQHLAWPLWVAVVAAVGLEALGLVIALTGLDNWTWNRSKRKSDPAAPVVLPVVLLAVYFVSAEALTFGLDIASGPVTFAKLTQAVFPVLGLAGMVTLAVRYDHEQRRQEVANGKAEEKAERKATRAAAKAATTPAKSTVAIIEAAALPFTCSLCGAGFNEQHRYAGHMGAHARARAAGGNGHERAQVVQEAQNAN